MSEQSHGLLVLSVLMYSCGNDMAVCMNWGSFLVVVFMLSPAIYCRACIRVPDFWKLPRILAGTISSHLVVARNLSPGSCAWFNLQRYPRGDPFRHLLSRKTTWNLKRGSPSTTVLFEGAIFRFHASLTECSPWGWPSGAPMVRHRAMLGVDLL